MLTKSSSRAAFTESQLRTDHAQVEHVAEFEGDRQADRSSLAGGTGRHLADARTVSRHLHILIEVPRASVPGEVCCSPQAWSEYSKLGCISAFEQLGPRLGCRAMVGGRGVAVIVAL